MSELSESGCKGELAALREVIDSGDMHLFTTAPPGKIALAAAQVAFLEKELFSSLARVSWPLRRKYFMQFLFTTERPYGAPWDFDQAEGRCFVADLSLFAAMVRDPAVAPGAALAPRAKSTTTKKGGQAAPHPQPPKPPAIDWAGYIADPDEFCKRIKKSDGLPHARHKNSNCKAARRVVCDEQGWPKSWVDLRQSQ